jgi:hypothetical protein
MFMLFKTAFHLRFRNQNAGGFHPGTYDIIIDFRSWLRLSLAFLKALDLSLLVRQTAVTQAEGMLALCGFWEIVEEAEG